MTDGTAEAQDARWRDAAQRLTRLLAHTGSGVDGEPVWSPDGKSIYFLHSSTFEPSSLVVAPAKGDAAKTLIRTQPVNFANTGLALPEVVHYKSKDGLAIAAILYKPLNYAEGTTYPAVLWIHGGPEGQDTLGWDPWALYLAQHGYVVLNPNYRGSSGYGEKFRNLNVGDSGGGEVDDVALGAEYLVSSGLADKARLGIGGGSHGGTMVAYEVTKRPELWHAAIESTAWSIVLHLLSAPIVRRPSVGPPRWAELQKKSRRYTARRTSWLMCRGSHRLC